MMATTAPTDSYFHVQGIARHLLSLFLKMCFFVLTHNKILFCSFFLILFTLIRRFNLDLFCPVTMLPGIAGSQHVLSTSATDC